jgi:hypothetical protein
VFSVLSFFVPPEIFEFGVKEAHCDNLTGADRERERETERERERERKRERERERER